MGGSQTLPPPPPPYSPSPFVPSAQTASALQQNPTSTTLRLALLVLIGVCARCLLLPLCTAHSPCSDSRDRCNVCSDCLSGERAHGLLSRVVFGAAGICTAAQRAR